MKLRLFVILACAYLLGASREQPWGDANVVYTTAQNLVESGRIDVSLGGPPQFYSIRNGKKYGVFPLGNVIAHAPSYVVYRALRALPHKPVMDALLFRLCSHISSSLMMAGCCVLLMVLLRREGASERAALWLALLAGGGTILCVYARVPYSEALQSLAFTWLVERAFTVGDRPTIRGGLWLGVACGLLVNTKLVYAACLFVVPLYIALHNRHRLRQAMVALLASGIPLAAMVGFALWHNHLKTGTLFDSGYRIPEGVFSGDAYAALYGFFLSTGKSVFLYSPPLVLAAFALPTYLRERRAHALFLIAISVVVVGLNAKFRYWHADYCWGPRLLVPLTAAWLLPIAPWVEGALDRGRVQLRAVALGAAIGCGLWAQLLGSAFYWDHYIRIAIAVKDQTGARGWYTEDLHHCHFIPEFSPLIGHAWLLRHIVHDDGNLMADAPWRRVIADPVNLSNEWAGVKTDWWITEWRSLPGARGWMVGIVLALLAAIAAAAVGLVDRLFGSRRRAGDALSDRAAGSKPGPGGE